MSKTPHNIVDQIRSDAPQLFYQKLLRKRPVDVEPNDQQPGQRPSSPNKQSSKWPKYLSPCSNPWFWESVSVIFSLLCLTAIFVILAVYNNRPSPSPPHGLTLNAIVSILATGSKSSLIFVTSESIGQLKWIWFRTKRTLIDMQTFDNASRGPWGCVILLYKHKGSSLVSLGVIVTVLALAFDPFMQQLFSYPVRQVASPAHVASVKQGHPASLPGNLARGEGLQAVNVGMWAEDFGITPSCPSGNCTWPEFQSMGYCAKCEDVTSTAILVGCDHVPVNISLTDELKPILCNITQRPPLLPLNICFTFDRHVSDRQPVMSLPHEAITFLQATEQFKIVGIQNPMQTIEYVKIERLDGNDTTTIQHEEVQFKLKELTECAFTPCIRVYNISVSNGTPSVNVVSEEFGGLDVSQETVRRTSSNPDCWEPDSHTHTSFSHPGNGTKICGIPPARFRVDEFEGESNTACNYHADNSTWVCGRNRGPESQSLNAQHVLEAGIEHTLHNVAASLTKLALDRSNRTVLGTVFTDELRNFLNLPVPRVYAWSSRASENPLGADVIIMEKQAGVVLTDAWDTIKGKQKVQILDQFLEMERCLATTKFSKFGSLYYRNDLPNNSDSTTPLYIDSTGNETRSKTFGTGPTNHRSFFDFGRGELDIERGPWSTVTEYMTAIVRREIAAAKAGLRYPLMPEGLFYGPRQWQPTLSKKLSALENYLKVAPYVLPENKATHASVLWHGDLHSQNIFVNPEDPSRIVGIIDWQSVSTCPPFMHVGHQAFLDYDGPDPENLGKVPLPPNFDSMCSGEQQKAQALHRAQTLHNLYLVRCLQFNGTAFRAIRGQNTLRHQVSVVPGLVLMDYEQLLNCLLIDVEKEWTHIVGVGEDSSSPNMPFPLQFSDEETQQQEQDGELWAQGVELMEAFVSDTGVFKHWDGRVSDLDYEKSRRELDERVKRFLDREARDDEERREWLKALPFMDQSRHCGNFPV